MRHNQHKALLFLNLLCLGIMLSGIVLADDQSGQMETYGAYPGAPVSTSSPTPTPSQQIVTAYPGQPSPATPVPSGQPTVATGPVAAYPGPVTSTSSTATAIYYTQAPPVTQQNVLLTYNIQTAPPAAVYYSGTYMPWTSFYQVFPASSPAFWVSSSAGWSWYATCPLGSWAQELMYVPSPGSMKVYELYPDGTTKSVEYGWVAPGYKYVWFDADTPGRHIDMVTVSGIPSNYVTIDVA